MPPATVPTVTVPTAAPSPPELSTVTQSPAIPAPTVTSADNLPAGDSTPIPEHPEVECTLQDDVIACYDTLLAMTFSYPAFMGEIQETVLRAGGYAGFSYEYMLNGEGAMGGRSRDFSEGRGRMFTDQMGFDGRAATEICPDWQAATCVEINPSVVVMVMYPESRAFCTDSMFNASPPHAIVAVDLPGHPLIHGFGFAVSLASPAWSAAYYAEWRSDDRMCDPAVKADFDARMEQLRLDLEAGTAEADIQARYDAMLRLAASVQSPFMDAAP